MTNPKEGETWRHRESAVEVHIDALLRSRVCFTVTKAGEANVLWAREGQTHSLQMPAFLEVMELVKEAG